MTTPLQPCLKEVCRILSGIPDISLDGRFGVFMHALQIPVSKQSMLKIQLERLGPIAVIRDVLGTYISQSGTELTVEGLIGTLETFDKKACDTIREKVLWEFQPTNQSEAVQHQAAKVNHRLLDTGDNVVIWDHKQITQNLAYLLEGTDPGALGNPAFRSELHYEIESMPSLKEAWSEGEKKVISTKAGSLFSPTTHLDAITELDMMMAVATFTYGGDFYREFNLALRDHSLGVPFRFPCYFKLLYGAILALRSDYGKGVEYLYRGLGGGIAKDKLRKGVTLGFQQFTSASKLEAVAEGFVSMPSGTNTVLWKIMPTNQGRDGELSASIGRLSIYPGEEEVIFAPFMPFVIQSVQQLGHRTVVTLKAVQLPTVQRKLSYADPLPLADLLDGEGSDWIDCIPFVDSLLQGDNGRRVQVRQLRLGGEELKHCYEKAIQFWISRVGREATVDALVDVLEDLEMYAVASKVRSYTPQPSRG